MSRTPTLTEAALSVTGMDCASCVAHVNQAIQSVAGVAGCDVNLARGRATVRFDPAATDPQQVADAVTRVGYPAMPEAIESSAHVEQQRLERQMHEARSWFRRALVGVLLWFPLEAIHWTTLLLGAHHAAPAHRDSMAIATFVAATISIIYVGGKFYRSAWSALRRRTTNMDVLIAMGATVAYGYSLVFLIGGMAGWWTPPAAGQLFFMEGAGLLALISLGHWLEARARQTAGSAIRELLDLTPATALRLRGSDNGRRMNDDAGPRSLSSLILQPSSLDPETVPVADLRVGDVILIRPGDRIATDGVVVGGTSAIDESMISGEPLPVTRSSGDPVIGGTVNRDGALQVRVAKVGSETALAQIVRLVETAQNSKPPVQQLADKISAVFVPVVLGIALLTGIGWYIYGLNAGLASGVLWGKLANAVCSVLIIACPCALGLAVPAALMVGTGRGAKRGILLRDIDALQKAEKIDTVVLDKTGTITLGQPRVAEVTAANGTTEVELLSLAASAEQFSEHPIAKAIVAYARERKIGLVEPESFANEPGLGVVARVKGRSVLVGSEKLLVRSTGYQPVTGHGLVARATEQTIVHVAEQCPAGINPLGTIGLTDTLKPDSVAAVAALHGAGLRTALLTGDHQAAAEAVAGQVGIDQIHAGVLPSGKADVVKRLQAEGRIVAMVGDGINDAPALAQANLGIAIGSGSDIAKETGDIVLVSGSLHGVSEAIGLSRATMRVIRQNLFFAFFYNVLAIPLAATGMLSPLIAAAAMALSDVTVLGNALRLRRMKLPHGPTKT